MHFCFLKLKNSGVHTDYSIGINSLSSIFFGAFLGTVTTNSSLLKEALTFSVRTLVLCQEKGLIK